MLENIGSAPTLWLITIVLSITFCFAAIVYWIIFILGKNLVIEVSPGLLTPVSVTFGLIIGFLASQVWVDNGRAFAAVMQEASALKTILTVSEVFPSSIRQQLDTGAINYIDRAVIVEWPEMGRASSRHGMIDKSEKEGLRAALLLVPKTESQVFAKQQLVIAYTTLYQARAERLLLSGTSVNYLKWLVVISFALLIMIITAFVHRANSKSAILALILLAFAISLSFILILAHDRPFAGVISISPDILLNVRPLRVIQ